jgi:hypothetical protein
LWLIEGLDIAFGGELIQGTEQCFFVYPGFLGKIRDGRSAIDGEEHKPHIAGQADRPVLDF